MIAILIKLLSSIGLTEKAAKLLAPVVVAGAALAGFWLIRHDAYTDGQRAAQAASERALNDYMRKAHADYLAAEKAQRESYEQTINAVAAIKGETPQIIREIRNAPATACSGVPISDDEWLWLRRSFDRTAPGDALSG